MNTPAMKNVEEVFTKRGGEGTHKPAHEALKDGKQNLEQKSDPKDGAAPIGTKEHEEKFGDQHPQVSFHPWNIRSLAGRRLMFSFLYAAWRAGEVVL
jgi:hypothetical protein